MGSGRGSLGYGDLGFSCVRLVCVEVIVVCRLVGWFEMVKFCVVGVFFGLFLGRVLRLFRRLK